MRKIYVGAITLALGATSLSAAYAETAAPSDMKMTQAQCETLWTQALAGATGDVAMDQARPYVKDFKKADKNTDNKLSQVEWMDACNQGWIQSSASTGAGDGTSAASGKTSDRTPDGEPTRTPGAGRTGAAGTDAGQTPHGTSDRTPNK